MVSLNPTLPKHIMTVPCGATFSVIDIRMMYSVTGSVYCSGVKQKGVVNARVSEEGSMCNLKSAQVILI